ncbi:MAG: hypothetical protein GYB64_14530 [Chloroflexi bacterium]|nr:hypothetical protein [Chloroflexota bacterium]
MTRLDDRLAAIERRLDEIQALLLRLVELQTGGEVDDLPEANLQTVHEVLNELGAEVAYDPLEIQYQLARDWAEGDRAEEMAEFDLSGRNLRGVDLKDAVLTRANLAKADLTGAKLMRAALDEADLSRCRLDRADLSGASMEGADLTFAHVTYCKLEGTNLRFALLTRANMNGANLSSTNLAGAQLNRAILTRANLTDAQVSYKQLASTSALDGATMPDGRLFDGDFSPYANYR